MWWRCHLCQILPCVAGYCFHPVGRSCLLSSTHPVGLSCMHHQPGPEVTYSLTCDELQTLSAGMDDHMLRTLCECAVEACLLAGGHAGLGWGLCQCQCCCHLTAPQQDPQSLPGDQLPLQLHCWGQMLRYRPWSLQYKLPLCQVGPFTHHWEMMPTHTLASQQLWGEKMMPPACL